MIQFLQPIAWLGLLGLLVPLLIHLWERRQGRRVLVGSLRWLEETAARRVSRPRFTDPWRFLLRTLVLTLFVLLLVRPEWRRPPAAAPEPSWVLIDPEWPDHPGLMSRLDSLRRRGPLRLLAPGFPDWDPEAPGAGYSGIPYWTLLRDLDSRPGAPDSVTVIAYPYLSRFRGKRPALHTSVNWVTPPAEPPRAFLAGAWTAEDEARLLLGATGAEGLSFAWRPIPLTSGSHPLPDFPDARLAPGASPDSWTVELASRSAGPVTLTPLPPVTVRIWYDEPHDNARRRLEAALRTAARYAGRRVDVEAAPVGAVADTAKAPDWTFWLPDAPPPARTPGQWVFYQPDTLSGGDIPAPSALVRQVDGRIVLRQNLDDGYELLQSGDRLPRTLVEGLLLPPVNAGDSPDERLLADGQPLPLALPDAAPRQRGAQPVGRDLHLPLWVLLLALFLLERAWPFTTGAIDQPPNESGNR